MKNRTIICSAIIIAAQMLSATGYAYTKVTQSGTSDAAVIKADGNSAYEVVPVMVLKAGKDLSNLENATKDTPTEDIADVVGYMGSLSADKEGNVYSEIDLSGFAAGNSYGILVNGTLYNLKYVKNADRAVLISEMLVAANANDANTLRTKFSANKDCLSIDDNIMSASAGVSDASVAAVLLKEMRGKSTISIDEMSDISGKAMLVAALNANKITDKEIVDHILDGGQYSAVNGALKDKIKANGLNDFVTNINGKAYTSVADADNGAAKELILDAICYPKNETTSEILAVLESYNGILGLDLTEFNKLSNENKANVIRNFSNSKPSLDKMQSTLNSLVAPLKASGTPVAGGGGGGGGGVSGGISGSDGSFIGMQGGANAIFSDVAGFSWAQDAIMSLYSQGIISGYGDGSFAPQNNIKREEFVTIAVSAFYKDAESQGCDFADVAEDAWYYKNIAIASNQGIISGIGGGLFGVGENITRQDMAVILYRIAWDRLSKPETPALFADDSYIADYAKEAVYALKAAGVINGVSATEFAPRKNATRAETAVMVYRFINLIGKGGV